MISAKRKPIVEFLLPKVIEALDHPLRYKILNLLQEEPNRELSYSEIREALNVVNTATLNHHLNVLLNAHLIKTRIDVDALRARRRRQYYSFYSLTHFGQTFLKRFVALVDDALKEVQETDDNPTQIFAGS